MATPDNVKITKDSAQVIIERTRIAENWNKTLTLITAPKTDAQQGIAEGKNDTRIVDLLLKAEQRFTIDGFIGDSAVNRSVDGSKDKTGAAITDATDILNTFREIFFAGGTFDIDIDGTTYTVNSDKLERKNSSNDKDTYTSYEVKFTIIVGVDL